MKVYKYDLWATLFISSGCGLTGIKLLITPTFFDILGATFIIFLLFLSIYILWISPMRISINRDKLYIREAFMFPKKIQWKDILSIKTIIFLGTPNLIIEFLQEEKRKKINIPSLIIGYKELTKEIVEKANNANIDYKTKAFLQGELGHPEIFSLRLARILYFILLPIFIWGLFIWL